MTIDLDDFMHDGVLYILANGFFGHTHEFHPSHLNLKKNPNGSYSFTDLMKFENEPNDDVVGTIQDRHIVFTRTRTGTNAFVQKYDGWLFQRLSDKCVAQMAGTFSHNGSTLYGWCGWLGRISPA